MNRLTFIKRLVMGAAAVPAVMAASKATKSRRKLYDSVNYPDVIRGFYDQSGNGNHIFLKPEDAPLYKPHTSV